MMVGCHNEQRAGPPAATSSSGATPPPVVWDPLKKSHVQEVGAMASGGGGGTRGAVTVAVAVSAAEDAEEAVDRARRRGPVGFLFFRPRALLKNRTAGRPASQPYVCVCVHRQLRRRQLKRSVKEGKKKCTLHAHHNSHSHYIIIRARPCVCVCLFANINSFITFFFFLSIDTLLHYDSLDVVCTRAKSFFFAVGFFFISPDSSAAIPPTT